MKFDINYVREFVALQGYKLLSQEYVNSQVPLVLECPKGHIAKPRFADFKRKPTCNDCSRNKRPTIRSIQDQISTSGFKLISTEYVNKKSKLKVKCPKNHIWDISWNNLQRGNGCPDCYGNRRHTVTEVKDYIKDYGYEFHDTQFKNVDTKIDLLCPNGHTYSTRFHDFKTGGSRCNSCSHQTSRAEQSVLTFVQQYYSSAKKAKFYEIVDNCPKEYKNKEIDIYIPELKIAIEYCGLYWHSCASGEKNPKQHRNKLVWCTKNGIRLITIFEDEWLNRQAQVKNLLKSVIGVNYVKVGARKCTLVEIDNNLASEFITEQHIQPLNVGCLISFGLYYNDDLVGVITGSRHHRNNQSDLVLQRLCFKDGYQIVGGASKLFSALKKYAVTNGYESVISWSDNRISEGNVYEKLNFTLKREYTHDYSYVLNGKYDKRYSKQSMKKTKEERLTGKTELELRTEQGYYRIWDCGKKTWKFNLK